MEGLFLSLLCGLIQYASMSTFLLKGGRIIIPSSDADHTGDVFVRDGKIESISTNSLDVDVPTIDALLCVGSKKSRIKTMQRLGRGLRGKKLIVVEFANFTHDYLLKHSLMRLKDYKNEDCFIIRQSPPNADLVDELWNMD